MIEEYKLGLSRNRLFEFESTVVFRGKYKGSLSEEIAQAVMQRLAVKEPVITANIRLAGEMEAYIVTGAVSPQLSISRLNASQIEEAYCEKPLLFTERLFEFTFSKDGYLVIAGHTVVCDAKSLLRLAKYFAEICENTDISAEPGAIYTFAEPKSLPVDVVSPIVNKLSSELDNKWQRARKQYTLEDYLCSKEKYISSKEPVNKKTINLSAVNMQQYISFCKFAEVDFSSLLYFSFYKAICSNFHHTKNASKMRIFADRRFFHGEGDRFSIGAYNGSVCVSLTKGEMKKDLTEQLKAFHLDAYKALTSPFRVFSDEILLASVQQSLCDASYMCLAGVNKAKVVKDFAATYGCMNKELCDCFYCNLTQRYWEPLQEFEEIGVEEPFKPHRAPMSISAVESEGGCSITLRYSTTQVSDLCAEKIIEEAIQTLENITK